MDDNNSRNVTLSIAVRDKTCFDGDIVAYVFRRDGTFVGAARATTGTAALPLSPDTPHRHKVFLGPALTYGVTPTVPMLRRLPAFEAALAPGEANVHVDIPAAVVGVWPRSLCRVAGRVMRAGHPVRAARVHVCDVYVTRWLHALPAADLFRLRDDLIDLLRGPPALLPPPLPELSPGQSFDDPALAFARTLRERRTRTRDSARKLPRPIESLSATTIANLGSQAASCVRRELIERIALFYPYLCLARRWRRLYCNEIAVRPTDSDGRFSVLVPKSGADDTPDVYLWVELPSGGQRAAVYRPPVACNTSWDYRSGSDIAINITHSRVPTCDPARDLDNAIVRGPAHLRSADAA